MGEPERVGEILSNYTMKVGIAEVWVVPSRSDPERVRMVCFFENGSVACSCPSSSPRPCRHIKIASKARKVPSD